jgi:hypothetical protein
MHATIPLPPTTPIPALNRPAADSTVRDVIHVLLLVQGATALLGGLGMLLFMQGNPAVWPVAVGLPALLFVLATKTRRNRRWARRTASVIQWLMLTGFAISALLSLLPALDFSVNLMTLLTNLVLPITLIKLLRRAQRIEVAWADSDSESPPPSAGEAGAQRPEGAFPSFESADAAI